MATAVATAILRSRASKTIPLLRALCRVRGFSSSSVPSNLETVGFIGIGNMGFHMATNLISAGYKLTVHDIDRSAMKKFLDMGIPTKETPFEIAESSDVIITMLPSSSHVLNVFSGEHGLLHGGSHLRPWLFVDSSTIDPHTSRNLSANISKCLLKENKGYADTPVMLDAPVSGGVSRAEAGSLTFMVGGPEEAYLAAKPLFLSMGKNIIYCGGSGNGSAAKICNNLAMAVSMLGVSEAFALGQSLGITARTLKSIFDSSTARCWSRFVIAYRLKMLEHAILRCRSDTTQDKRHSSSDSYNPVPGLMADVASSRNYDGGFSSKLMAKDLNLAMVSAKEVGVNCPVTAKAQHIYTELCKQGHDSKDFSCAFRYYYSGKDEK